MNDLREDLHYLLNRAEAEGGKVVSIEAVRQLLFDKPCWCAGGPHDHEHECYMGAKQ